MLHCSTAKSSSQATLNQILFSVAHNMDEQGAEREALRTLLRNSEKKAFAEAIGLPGGASMLSQHLSGNRPISLDAGIRYANGFGVRLDQISPRLAEQARAAIVAMGDAPIPPANKECSTVRPLAPEQIADALLSAPAEVRAELAQVLGLLLSTGAPAYRQRLAELLALAPPLPPQAEDKPATLTAVATPGADNWATPGHSGATMKDSTQGRKKK